MSVIPQSDPIPLPETHRWVYERCRPCLQAGPFMIGAPVWGCETHHVGNQSIPCYRELHGCSLTCPRCPQRSQWTAYIPLIECTGKHARRIVYTGGMKAYRATVGLKPGTLVCVTRGTGQTDTINVSVWPTDRHYAGPVCAAELIMPDITPYLLHLWQQRELTEHFGQRFFRARGKRHAEGGPRPAIPRSAPSPAADIALKLAAGMKPE